MTKFTFTRDFYIPKGFTAKIEDKQSDAIAYLWNSGKTDKPGATIFIGKQAKPISNYYYGNEAKRERAIIEAFESRRASLNYKSKVKADRKAWVCPFKVGDIFSTCWGYDQTNIEYFEIIELCGKHAMLRELAQSRTETAFMQGKCVPLRGEYIGEPIRRLCQERGFKISHCRWASPARTTEVAGIKVVEAGHWTAYA